MVDSTKYTCYKLANDSPISNADALAQIKQILRQLEVF